MTDFPDLKIKALVSFPAAVFGGTGLAVRQANGQFFFDLAYGELAPIGSVATLAEPTTFVALWEQTQNTYRIISITDFKTEIGGGVPEAPNDGVQYARQNLNWTPVTGGGGGIPEAPADSSVYGRRNAAWAKAVALAGDTMTGSLTLSAGVFSGGAKGHVFGNAGGTAATGAVAIADANIQLYNGGASNWAGIGTDASGHMWFKVGAVGSPVPAFWLNATDQSANFAVSPLAPTPATADNSGKVANTAYVNNKLAAVSGIPSGTVMLFYQANAPTGWTKLVTQNDKALRVVSGSGGVAGGTNAFSTVMAQTVVGNHTLTTAEIASHGHSYTAPGANVTVDANLGALTANVAGPGTGSTTGSQGGGGAHNHPITMAIQYIDVILASKD